jgi:hypothetical protein
VWCQRSTWPVPPSLRRQRTQASNEIRRCRAQIQNSSISLSSSKYRLFISPAPQTKIPMLPALLNPLTELDRSTQVQGSKPVRTTKRSSFTSYLHFTLANKATTTFHPTLVPRSSHLPTSFRAVVVSCTKARPCYACYTTGKPHVDIPRQPTRPSSTPRL